MREAKLMILVNVVLAVLFVVSDYLLMSNIGIWSGGAVRTSWNLFEIRFGPSQGVVEGVGKTGNLTLVLFFLTIAANLVFILRLQRTKETNPTRNV